jgi:hypothetical protein
MDGPVTSDEGDQQHPHDQEGPGSSIAEVFPPGSVAARFAVAMSIAKNDVERALRDVLRAGENDDPDFTYRVRLATGHLVEALDALNAYTEYDEVKSMLAGVATEGQRDLKVARRALQEAGREVLQHVRDNTFHYPSPRKNYSPTSDAQLEQVLTSMGARRAEVHVNFESKEVTMTFADDAALALAMGKHAPTRDDLVRQFEAARDGALAFIAWAQALVLAFFDMSGTSFGTPEAK